MFSESASQRHIPICATLISRPKPLDEKLGKILASLKEYRFICEWWIELGSTLKSLWEHQRKSNLISSKEE